MSPADAAKLLDLPADASPEQLEARFLELRRKLEDKIAKAPTPGLQAKYRESLAEITAAFETLTLAADSSALPVAQRTGSTVAGVADPGAARAHSQSPGSATPATALRRKSGGKEFAIVAVVAIALLAGGGWFVMKTRAENAEKARIAAEQKLEAARQAEAQKKAEQEEKVRLAAAERAEQEGREKLLASLRSRLAELNVTAEALFRDEPAKAARVLSELKSEERALARDASAPLQNKARTRLAAQQAYVDQIETMLARHPAKLAQARAAEMLSARQPVEAEAALNQLAGHLQAIEQAFASARQQAERNLHGSLAVGVDARYGNVTWTFTDAFGEKQSGSGSRLLDRVAPGPAEIVFTCPGWPVQKVPVNVRAATANEVRAEFVPGSLSVTSDPAGAEVLVGSRVLGRTPLHLSELPAGPVELAVRLKGYEIATLHGTVTPREELKIDTKLTKYFYTFGEATTLADLKLTMVPIAAGTFAMGSASVGETIERPVTQVTLSQPYWLGRTEITQAQWQAIMGSNPSGFRGGNLPVEQVSWDDAMAFCRKLTEREQAADRLPEGYVYSLPTEAQWEYACRAGTTGDYAGNLDAMGWYAKNSGRQTHPVAQKQANAWGLYDMHGNVSEWCADAFATYPGGSVADPTADGSGAARVARGGYWGFSDAACRSSRREPARPASRVNGLGFRVALVPSN